MELKFLKLGKYTINVNAIAYINWNSVKRKEPSGIINTVSISFSVPVGDAENFGAQYIEFDTNSEEAKALERYFQNPKFVAGLSHDALDLDYNNLK